MSDPLMERYAAVERLYSQGQWAEVLDASAALLAELHVPAGDPLQTRLLLLQGHTHLYGLGELERASALYQQVLASRCEPMLQAIAQQELARCNPSQPEAAAKPVATPSVSSPASTEPLLGSDFPLTAAAVGTAPSSTQASAMPWLEALGGSDPAAGVVGAASANQVQLQAAAPWVQSEPVGSSGSEARPDPLPEPDPPADQELPADPPAAAAKPEPAAIEEIAIATVIEEPEQIEVQQADPSRAEVVDLNPVEVTPQVIATADNQADNPAAAQSKPRWSPAEEAELAKGLLTVVLG